MLITFEGGEGAGKSTQAELLAQRLRHAGREALVLREPGGTELGEALRRLLMHDHAAKSIEAEVLLFLAARAELVNTVIRPALQQGTVVVCDRFSDSTIAYQGYGRGVDTGSIRTLNRWATGGLEPDVTVLLDVPVEVGRRRKHGDDDIFYRESEAFHTRVREGYHFLAARDPGRWLVVDGTLPPEEIAAQVWERVKAKLAGMA
ncbi:MAG TPA: dTMP kinase [Dehalococcoidia bacterium]|nr:dTMP kinase [Dehalococcoidia bacterium]